MLITSFGGLLADAHDSHSPQPSPAGRGGSLRAAIQPLCFGEDEAWWGVVFVGHRAGLEFVAVVDVS